jgi:hypothetical protein
MPVVNKLGSTARAASRVRFPSPALDHLDWTQEPSSLIQLLKARRKAVSRKEIPMRLMILALILAVATGVTATILAYQAGDRHGSQYSQQQSVSDFNDGYATALCGDKGSATDTPDCLNR